MHTRATVFTSGRGRYLNTVSESSSFLKISLRGIFLDNLKKAKSHLFAENPLLLYPSHDWELALIASRTEVTLYDTPATNRIFKFHIHQKPTSA